MQRIFYFLLLAASFTIQAVEFNGWQGLRVIPHEGLVSNLTVIDIAGDGKESLFAINRRQSRIDIFSYVEKKDRKKVIADPDRPNELFSLIDFKRDEITLERPPLLMKAANLDKDKNKEILIVTSNPLTLHRYDYEGSKWVQSASWRLLQEKVNYIPFIIQDNKVYLSCEKGIMVQELKPGVSPHWMLPAEKNTQRLKWWFTDINNDSKVDLLELVIGAGGKIVFHWKENFNGRFLPSVPLGTISGDTAKIDESHAATQFYFQNAIRSNTVSSYELTKGEKTEYGKNRLLPLLNSNAVLRTSIMLDGKPCLVEIDPDRPQMRVSSQMAKGFEELGTFPVLRNVKAIASPLGKDIVLYHIKDSSDLYISRWENGRFTFPKLFMQDEAKATRKILGLKRQAGVLWWVQTVDKDLLLYKWKSGDDKPIKTVYKGIGQGLDRAFWLGGGLLMVRKKYAKYSTFYTIKNEKPEVLAADHMKDASEDQFKLFPQKEKVMVTRLVDGVLQLIGDDLQPTDQVMLSNGRRISNCILNDDGSMLVLDTSGKNLYRLEKDKSGVMREKSDTEIPQSSGIEKDPYLGLLLTTKTYLNSVTSGTPFKFKLKQTVDSKLGLPVGVKKADIHRFELLDVTGDGKNELVNFDYTRHQITIIDLTGKKAVSLASWKVFDDGKYPYSDGRKSYPSNRHPYLIKSLDFDGDGINELVLPCQDRILIYIGREEK